MTTGRAFDTKAVAWAVADTTAWDYGFRARRQIGLTDLPAPRNDIEFVTPKYDLEWCAQTHIHRAR
jgi:hypothetical protein